MIVVCANVKGGPGKSCLAQNIAVYLQVVANKKVMLIDADPQETTADWINERRENENLPDIRFAKMTGKIRDDLLAVETQYDCIVVDSGGHDTATMRFAMAAATHILIPFRPKRRDLKLLPKMEEILDLIKPVNPDAKVAAVINQAPTLPNQAYRILDAKDACRSFGIEPINTIIANRNVYDDADEAGSSVIEMNTVSKAIEEIRALVKEFIGV